jgi:2',3'-cyclic-nucleotide 2'-phosphodiesterase (5'-nucleotidase family)
MTATVITPQEVLGPFATTSGNAGVHDFTLAASTAATTDAWTCTGRDLLILFNSGSIAYTATITSQVDEKHRTEDITTYSLAAGDYAAFGVGLTNGKGWMDSSKKITITTSNILVKVAVLRLPAGYP